MNSISDHPVTAKKIVIFAPNLHFMKKKYVSDVTVTENKPLNSSNFLIKLRSEQPLPEVKAGQFVNVEIPGSSEVFLRRPFSIFEVDYTTNEFSLLVKIVGHGSQRLSELVTGERISIIYPLGTPFTYPVSGEKILAIGGGSGLAPMLFLAATSGLSKADIDIIIGARSVTDHIDVSNYQEIGNIHFTTEDGTLGSRGFVTHHPIMQSDLSRYDKIYACGPLPMMQAVAALARRAGRFCEVSLENLMACGFGVCLCCIEPTVKGNLCVCTEGPVFNINDLLWEI